MIPQPRSTSDLVRRLRLGDVEAEAELVSRFSRGVFFLLRRLTRDPSRAEDLHQETFRLVIEKLRASELEDPDGLSPFIQGVARRLYLNDSRKTQRRKTDTAGELLPQQSDPAPTPLRATLISEKAAVLRRMLAELEPERDRRALYRYYLAEEDKETICRDLGLTAPQFNKVLHRARGRFRKMLESSDRLNLWQEGP